MAAVLTVALGLLLQSGPAAAAECPCNGEIPPIDMERAHGYMADAIFTGRVTAMEPDIRPGVREVDLAVDEVWQGEVDRDVTAEVLMDQADCGIDFSVGSDLLVLTVQGTADGGRDTGDATVILPCGGARAAEEAAAFGPGRPPDPSSDEDDDSGGVSPLLIGVPIGVAVAAVAAVVVVRRRAGQGAAT